MSLVRSVGLGFGLLALLSAGAATLSRAQQPREKTGGAGQDQTVQREQLVRLKTDVDLLQLEVDAVRGALLEALKKPHEQVLKGGAEQADIRAEAQIRAELDKILWMAVRSPVAVGEERINKLIKQLKSTDRATLTDEETKLVKEFLEGSETAKEALVRIELKARLEGPRRALEQQKKEFARLARILNEKKLALDDAERVYEREVR